MNARRSIVKLVFTASALLGMQGLGVLAMQAQSPTGPQTAPRGPDVIRIPATPQPDTPPVPPDEIIRRFAAKEDIFAKAREGYTYRKSVRVEEIGPDGKPSGQAEVVTETVKRPDGTQAQKASGGQDSTLQILSLQRDALEVLSSMPAFPLEAAAPQISDHLCGYPAGRRTHDICFHRHSKTA